MYESPCKLPLTATLYENGRAAPVARPLPVHRSSRVGQQACQVPVFCARAGQSLTDGYVRRILPGLARLAGVYKRVHAHGMRHTHAAQLRSEGIDIGIISKQLGHRSIATTARYLDHIAPLSVFTTIAARS